MNNESMYIVFQSFKYHSLLTSEVNGIKMSYSMYMALTPKNWID